MKTKTNYMVMMTKEDKQEIREMMEDVVGGRFDLIDYKLTKIEDQTTRTNGRVTKLESQELLHVQNCPQTVRIEKLEDNQKGNATINKWLLRGLAVISSIIGIGWIIIEIVDKVKLWN